MSCYPHLASMVIEGKPISSVGFRRALLGPSERRTVLGDALDAVAVEAVVAPPRGHPQAVHQPRLVPQPPLLLQYACAHSDTLRHDVESALNDDAISILLALVLKLLCILHDLRTPTSALIDSRKFTTAVIVST